MHELAGWESFYVIVGSSGAALTGLQFVVIALLVDVHRRGSSREIAAFATPTVMHFCAVLLVSALLSAPWSGPSGIVVALALTGVAGTVYAVLTGVRTARVTGYAPVLEDWMFHVVLPLAAYAVIAVAALLLPGRPEPALFAIGGMALLLLFVGIHNAWDTVTYVALGAMTAEEKPQKPGVEPAGKPPNS
jgi:hypothetical protein